MAPAYPYYVPAEEIPLKDEVVMFNDRMYPVVKVAGSLGINVQQIRLHMRKGLTVQEAFDKVRERQLKRVYKRVTTKEYMR